MVNFNYCQSKLKGKGRSEIWQIYLYGDKTIKVKRDGAEVLLRGIPPTQHRWHWLQSVNLATGHTIYELCLLSERGIGIKRTLANLVTSGKYRGKCVLTADSTHGMHTRSRKPRVIIKHGGGACLFEFFHGSTVIALEDRLRQRKCWLRSVLLDKLLKPLSKWWDHSKLVLGVVARDLLDCEATSTRRRLENSRHSVIWIDSMCQAAIFYRGSAKHENSETFQFDETGDNLPLQNDSMPWNSPGLFIEFIFLAIGVSC